MGKYVGELEMLLLALVFPCFLHFTLCFAYLLLFPIDFKYIWFGIANKNRFIEDFNKIIISNGIRLESIALPSIVICI